jgi:magnesium-transporting ATPase (P-type)
MDDQVRDRQTPVVAAGLSDAEARQRLAKDGPNELTVSKARSVLRQSREVASEPMFLLLVACGAICMLLGDRQEALMLPGFVFVVMGISFVQQRRILLAEGGRVPADVQRVEVSNFAAQPDLQGHQ